MIWPAFWGALFVLVVASAELALGVFVSMRSDRKAATRALIWFLLTHAVAFGFGATVVMRIAWTDAANPAAFRAEMAIATAAMSVFTVPLILYMACYPTPARSLRRHPWLAAPILMLPLATIWAATWEAAGNEFAFWEMGGDSVRGSISPFILIFSILVAGVAAWIGFGRRARQAPTELERRRLAFSRRVVAIPLVIAAICLAGAIIASFFVLLDTQVGGPFGSEAEAQAAIDAAQQRLNERMVPVGWLLAVGILILSLVPPIGLALGLLRYRILDLDLRLRITVSRSVVGGVFLATFFTIEQLAQLLVQDRIQGGILGALAMLPLFLSLRRLERLGQRVASRLFPGTEDPQSFLRERRHDIYRATYEDLSADGEVTERERRALVSLAKSMRLDASEVSTMERRVDEERGLVQRLPTPSPMRRPRASRR